MRRRTLGQTIAGLVWMNLAGAALCLLAGLGAKHMSGGLEVLLFFVIMGAGGLAVSVVARKVLRLDSALATAITIVVVVALVPGAPLSFYWLGGRGRSIHVSSAAEALADREARYFHFAAPRPDAERAVLNKRIDTVQPKGASRSSYLVLDGFAPLADGPDPARVFVYSADLKRVPLPVSTSWAADVEQRARARHRDLVASAGPWFRRKDDTLAYKRPLAQVAGPEPWLILDPVESPAHERFLRAVWLWVVAAIATLAAGWFAHWTQLAPLQEGEKRRGPYR